MKPQSNRQYGFSLLEVLFALMVLTVGLIFVASQFPIGLDNARQVAETTATALNTHNADVLTDLQCNSISKNTTNFINPDVLDSEYYFINNDGLVHPYYLPNARVNYLTSYLATILPGNPPYIVMDDPLNRYFTSAPGNQPTYTCAITHNPAPLNPAPVNNNEVPPQILVYPATLPYYYIDAANIGRRVCPPVTGYDKDVLRYMREKYSPPLYPTDSIFITMTQPAWLKWQRAIMEVAVNQRNLCTSMLYQCTSTNGNYRFFIFNCYFNAKSMRYPIQKINNQPLLPWGLPPNDYQNPQPFPGSPVGSQDRLFPTPWLVGLKNFIRPSLRQFNGKSLEIIYFNQSNDATANNYSDFPVVLTNLLRAGSRIVNANTGETYEIREVYNNPLVGYGFRLQQPMKATDGDMLYFWVYPPGIVRTGPGQNDFYYADTQPVRSLEEKTVRF